MSVGFHQDVFGLSIPEGPLGRVFAIADRARSYTVVGRLPSMPSSS